MVGLNFYMQTATRYSDATTDVRNKRTNIYSIMNMVRRRCHRYRDRRFGDDDGGGGGDIILAGYRVRRVDTHL